jgi:GNAT superfamily N-acetyltransferase
MHPITQVEVRRGQTTDAQAIADLLHRSFLEFKPLYTEGGFAATALGADQILERMKEGPVWIAMRQQSQESRFQKSIIGTVAAAVKGESVYLRGMAVVPEARGSGTGSRLLRQVEEWARNQGYARLFLSTTPFLDSAIRLYERFGFRTKAGGFHDLFRTPLLTMEKNLVG